MPPKKQLRYFKKTRKLAKKRKLEFKNDILKEDTSVLFKDELIEDLWIFGKVISQYGDIN